MRFPSIEVEAGDLFGILAAHGSLHALAGAPGLLKTFHTEGSLLTPFSNGPRGIWRPSTRFPARVKFKSAPTASTNCGVPSCN
jgi:hypothetical protein